ncbi:sodium channel protein Nach-like [Periplaneta americana]|uniref:sodium channel protein Nach-like n=1 Tax=Periplaneta americana TaxID=6978 RepID=UPI0037E783B6
MVPSLVGTHLCHPAMIFAAGVYVHSPYDVPDFTVDPTLQYRTPTEILETFKIHRVMKSVGLHSLGISQRKCVFSYENKLSVSPWYSQSMCLLQCRRDLAVKLCGCSPHVYNVQDETPICSVQDFSCLHANKALLKQNNVSECSCPYDCGFAKIIRLQSKHLSQRTESYGYYLRPELLQEMMFEHNVILSKLDMFASWGGTVSFFLGGSVLSLMEFLYLLVRYLILGLISYQHHKIQNWLRRYKAWCKKKIPKVCLAMNVKLKILKPRLKIATILPIQIPMSVLIRVIKDWLTASTIHGVKNFHNHSFIAIERLVWICLVLTSIVMSHHFAVQLVEERPILMYEETVSQTPLPFQFPAVYVLHALATLNESIEQLYDTETMVTEAEVRRGILYPNLQSFCGPIGCGYDIESLRAGIVPDMIAEQLNCSLNLLTCQINYQKFPCCKIFNSALTAEGPMLVANSMLLGKEEHEYPFYFRRLLSQPHYKVTFDMMFVNQKKKVLTSLFLVLSTDKTDVPFQSQLHYFMGTQEHNTGIGEVTVMETHVDPDVLELEPEDRTCRMPSETLPNSFFRNYGYGGCLLECRARVMLLLCGCVHYYSPVRGDVPRCDMKGIQCLVKNNEKFLSSRAIADCQCLPNCATSFFNLIRNERNYTDADKTTMHITYLPSYKKMQVRLNRGSLETFVGAGGLVSLFLGCSVLSIVEFIFYFTMRFTSQLLQELIGHYCVRRSTTNISPLRNR